MKISFTPRTVIKARRQQLLAGVLLLALVGSATYYLTLPDTSNAATTYTWSTNTDLALGTTASTTVNTTPDSVTLSLKGTSTTETTEEQFLLGQQTPSDDPYPILIENQAGGEITMRQRQVFAYTINSTPAIARSAARHTFLEGDLLYVSTIFGLSVINTQGTTDPGDDTLVTRYHTGSTPALGNNYVKYAYLANNLLYVSTFLGTLSVINTQGTTDPGDDTLVTTYSTSSTPALAYNSANYTFLDGNLLYVSVWSDGLYVINTQGTTDPGDDTLVTKYNTLSNPAIDHNTVVHAFIDSDLLYVSTNGGGLSVINTQGTTDPGDDTLVTTYNTGSTPALEDNQVTHAFLDGSLLYVSTFLGGLSVINTQGTTDPGDDTLVITYKTDSIPAINHNIVNNSFLAGTLLYVGTNGGVSVIDTSGNYTSSASYKSFPRVIADTTTGAIAFESTEATGNSVSLQYRTGDSEAGWINNFNDGTTTEFLGDFYAWGDPFNDVVESNGVISLSNPTLDRWADAWLDTGKLDNYFPIGSKVTVRHRINSDTAVVTNLCVFSDDWWDYGCSEVTPNEWFIDSFTASAKAFSKIGFYTEWNVGTWAPADSLEIDWIQIETPDSFGHWNAWSTPCTDNISCPVDPSDLVGNDWIQYKLNLATTDPQTTPTVNSVTWVSGYESSGTYTSNTKTFAKKQDLLTFNANATTPTGTSVTYSYTLNGGHTWLPITPGAEFPRGTTAESFSWKATLISTNPLVTPTINSVTITTVTHQENTTTSTSVAIRAANLEAQGRQAEADALRDKYRNRQLSEDDVKREIITILNKTIAILKRIAELKGEE